MYVTHSVKKEKQQCWHLRMARSRLWWKDEPTSWQDQHQSLHESERSRSSPRDIINCQNLSLINKVVKRRCGWRPGYMSAWFMQWDAARSRTSQRSNCCSGIQSHSLAGWFVTATIMLAARLSARWQRDFQRAELFVTKQIVTNLRDKYRITQPPCFKPSFFCLLFR